MHFLQSKDKNLIFDWLNSDSIKRIALKYNISETTLRRLKRKVLGKEEQHNFNSVMSNRIKEAYLKFEAEKNKNAQDYPLFSQINDITNKKEIKTKQEALVAYKKIRLLIERIEAIKEIKYPPEYEKFLLDVLHEAMDRQETELANFLETEE